MEDAKAFQVTSCAYTSTSHAQMIHLPEMFFFFSGSSVNPDSNSKSQLSATTWWVLFQLTL